MILNREPQSISHCVSICLFLDYKSIDWLALQVVGLLLNLFHSYSGSRHSSNDKVNVNHHGNPQGHMGNSNLFCLSYIGPRASDALVSIKGVRK